LMEDNEGGKVVLKVYNAKSQRIRGECIAHPHILALLVSVADWCTS
jgi:hypothetical protein